MTAVVLIQTSYKIIQIVHGILVLHYKKESLLLESRNHFNNFNGNVLESLQSGWNQ